MHHKRLQYLLLFVFYSICIFVGGIFYNRSTTNPNVFQTLLHVKKEKLNQSSLLVVKNRIGKSISGSSNPLSITALSCTKSIYNNIINNNNDQLLQKYNYPSKDIKYIYQRKTEAKLKELNAETLENFQCVRLKMDWAVENIKVNPRFKTKDVYINNCWKALYEAINHTPGKGYGKLANLQPIYYEALKWTNMRLNDAIGDIIGLMYKKYPVKELDNSGILGKFDIKVGEKSVNQLRKNGYVILDKKLSTTLLKKIYDGSLKLNYVCRGANCKDNRWNKNLKRKFNSRIRDGSVNWIQSQAEAARKIPIVLDLMSDPTLLYIIQEYLGCAPINVQTNTWWSVANGGGVNNNNYQQTHAWHQDFAFIKFVKVFLYINDVKKDNGAHRYVKSSFKNIEPVLKDHRNYQVSDRLRDKEIQKNYPGKTVYMEGGPGTILIEDTRGFHAGTTLKKGYRQLFQWEFAISSFRYSLDSWFPQSICKSELNTKTIRAIEKYKRMFTRFKFDNNVCGIKDNDFEVLSTGQQDTSVTLKECKTYAAFMGYQIKYKGYWHFDAPKGCFYSVDDQVYWNSQWKSRFPCNGKTRCVVRKKKNQREVIQQFKTNYFIDSYQSCQKNANSKNSLYLYLKQRLSKYVPGLESVKLTKENYCMKYAHNYSYNSHRDIKNVNTIGAKATQAWFNQSIELAIEISKFVRIFPEIPLDKRSGRPFGAPKGVDKRLSSSLTHLQQVKVNADIFFQRNFGPALAKRTNPLLQNMLDANLCKNNNNCPSNVLEFGCSTAANLKHYCGKHYCTRAICIEASTYSQFVNTMTLPTTFELLVGDLNNKKVYNNIPAKSFDLIYQSWALMYVSGLKFHIETLLPALYKGLMKGGYYAFEGPVGKTNEKGMMAATPIGSVKKSTKQNSIESTEFFLDHCRLLVATGHFKLLEDTRYQSKWSIVTDISTVNSITLKQYEDDPNARWEKKVKLENTNINWKQVVNSDCLIQKITDVSEVNFRNDLKSFVVRYV